MLEKLPHAVGHALSGIRPGLDAILLAEIEAGPARIELASPAFADGGAMPARFTADGDGVSPPLRWGGLPDNTHALALLVEDADSPTPAPLVHAIAVDLEPAAGGLDEGAMTADSAGAGRNSFLGRGWLPPDPPPGHGPHRYAFQLFALDRSLDLAGTPGRSALRDATAGRILAVGLLVGTYERP